MTEVHPKIDKPILFHLNDNFYLTPIWEVLLIFITLGIIATASYEYHSTSHSSTERSIPPMFTKCLVSSLSCSSEYCSAFSFESKTLSTLLACSSSTLAMTTHIFNVGLPVYSSFPGITILYPINASYQ